MVWQLPFLVGEVVDEVRSVVVVLAHIVVVDCLLDQPAVADERVDGPGRGVGHAKERLALDCAHNLPIDLDAWVRPDHL